MKGLATSSVLVVDNDPADGIPFLQALAAQGVGALYLSGDPDAFPRRGTLRGVRLVALDIHLVDGDRPDEEIARDPIRVLEAVVDRASGPYLVLLWTSRSDLADLFHDYAVALDWPPVKICVLSKSDVRDADGNFDLARITTAIETELARAVPLLLLMLWSQAVHDAASATLVSLGPENTTGWISEVKDLLAALVRENTPRAHITSHSHCLHALFEALDQVHADHLDTEALALAIDQQNAVSIVATQAARTANTNATLMRRINRSLLLGPGSDRVAAPGTIYFVDQLNQPIKEDLADIVRDSLEPLKENSVETVRARHIAATDGAVALAVELTPVCDYQQDSQSGVRLLGGIALPEEHMAAKRKAEYLRAFPPICFNDERLNGNYVLLWNAHFFVARPRSALSKQKGAYRVRQAPLADLFAFQAQHAARPGYLAIRR